jgi:HPt (histidine-containing phosphotransfer) domain-containing protein
MGIMAEAHHIKGASANVGALRVQPLAVKMEDLASSQSFESILGLLEDIQVQMKAIEQFVAEKVV